MFLHIAPALAATTADSADLGLLVLRLAVGAVFLAHGINHVFGGGKIEGTAGWFESLGMRPGKLHAWMASVTEIASGTLLVLGFLTPLAAAGIVGTMIVAWTTNHLHNGFFIFRPGEGWEYVATLTLLGIVIGTLGPGDWSIDGQISSLSDLSGFEGFAISLGAGAVGAALLLLAYWRPDSSSDDAGASDEGAF
jgi:putative oxidoreductase